MADPVSAVANAAGIISLGLSVCRGLLQYYESWKKYDTVVTAMYTQLESLFKTFALLERVLAERRRDMDPFIAVRVEESVESCTDGIMKLQKKLAKVRKTRRVPLPS